MVSVVILDFDWSVGSVVAILNGEITLVFARFSISLVSFFYSSCQHGFGVYSNWSVGYQGFEVAIIYC